jgi:hypothetical protein
LLADQRINQITPRGGTDSSVLAREPIINSFPAAGTFSQEAISTKMAPSLASGVWRTLYLTGVAATLAHGEKDKRKYHGWAAK